MLESVSVTRRLFEGEATIFRRRELGCSEVRTAVVVQAVIVVLLRAGTLSADTRQDFDCDPVTDPAACTPYTLGTHNMPAPPTILSGGWPTGNFLRLADGGALPPVVNSIDFDTTDAGPHCEVTVDFDFRISPRPGPDPPADGLSVAFLNTGVFGDGGAVAPMRPVYVSEEPNFTASLGVGFDIYQNVEPGDIDDNHVSVHWDGELRTQVTSPVTLATGQLLHARVELRATGGGAPEVSVFLRPDGGVSTTVIDGFEIPDLVPYGSRIHLGARSGGRVADHDVDNIVATFRSCPAASGLVIVEKQTDPSGADDGFPFSGDVTATLHDDEWATFAVAAPGTYQVTEAVFDSWVLDDILCLDDDSTVDLKSRTATYRVDAGESVRCVFTNSDRLAPVSCAAARILDCEDPVVLANNAGPGSSRSVNRYSCLESAYRGRELIYSFQPPADGRYSLRLDGLAADLDLVVLGPDSCSSDRCAAASDASGSGAESVSFDALADQTWFVAVDGVGSATSDFTLTLTCPTPPQADFSLSPEFPTAGQPVQLFDTSTGEPTSSTWDFGDGAQGRGPNPFHTFLDPGTFDVRLTVANAAGVDAVERPIEVAPPRASIEVEGPETGEVDEVLTFFASAAGCRADAEGWRWTVAGGEVTAGGAGDRIDLLWRAGGTKVLGAVNRACGETAGSLTVEIARRQTQDPPAAPSGLEAEALSATEIRLSWQDNAGTEDAFVIERRQQTGGSFSEIGVVPADTRTAAVSVAGAPEPTAIESTFRVKAFNVAGPSAPSNQASATTTPESCDPARTLCLLDKRFKVEADWQDFRGNRGLGKPVTLTSDTGYFWFFGPDNVELVVKVIDGRGITGHYWVFYGSLSNVGFNLMVTDTETGNTKTFVNPPGHFSSVGDTLALPPEGKRSTSPRSFPLGNEPSPVVRKGSIGVDFGWSPGKPAAGGTVLFDDRSESPPSFFSRTWDFGDETERTSAPENTITHTFSTPGTFDVTLEVADISGRVFAPETRTRRVSVTPPPVPRITVDGPSSTGIDDPVTLSASANEHCTPLRPRGWEWQTSGGTIQGSSDRSTLDVFWTTPGSKRIVVRNAGCSTVSASRSLRVEADDEPPPERCEPSPEVLCLGDSRFRVEVRWKDFSGHQGPGTAVRLTNDTGLFWFFGPANVELVLKVVDGRCFNDHFWVFYGALSNVEYRIAVTDTHTGKTRSYLNPSGQFASAGDVLALPEACPGPG